MLLSPVYGREGRVAWDNMVLYQDGWFYAFFGTGTHRTDGQPSVANGIDVYRSRDGLHFECIVENACPIPTAVAGYCFHKIGEWWYYYPTCIDSEKGVHFKIYRTRDFLDWEHLGDEHDSLPDRRIYRERWDELCILEETDETGAPVYYGYISSEPQDAVSPPACGMLRSTDGIHWQQLPPPAMEWGELPAQHGEVCIAAKIDGRYYLDIAFRTFLDSYGYSVYTFAADTPFGPFRPVTEKFRLCGNSRRNITWLVHELSTPEGMLAAVWLSHDRLPEIPSRSFALSTLKRLVCENGALRLGWWEKNAALADRSRPLAVQFAAAHPAPAVAAPRDAAQPVGPDRWHITASRDGVLLLSQPLFDKNSGIVLEGSFTCTDTRAGIHTHHHPAGVGFYFEETPGQGVLMCAETQGVTRSGAFRYADHRITDRDIYKYNGEGLVAARSGPLQGTCLFDFDDTVGPFGHASYAGIRHGKKHTFRLLARMDYFELYIDDLYVQTYTLPDTVTGRIGVCVFDGSCELELHAFAFL